MGKDTKIGLLVGVLVVVLFALVFFGGGSGRTDGERPEEPTLEPALATTARDAATDPAAARRETAERTTDQSVGRGTERVSGETRRETTAGDPSPVAPGTDRLARREDTALNSTRREDVPVREPTGDPSLDRLREAMRSLSESRSTGSGLASSGVVPPAPAPAGSTTHEVKAGDSYYAIAKAQYGKSSLWPIIKAANGNRETLTVGMKLVIPPKPAESATMAGGPAPAPGPAPLGPNEYEVKADDNLWKIAAQHLGNGAKYLLIFEANRDKLRTPSQTLTVGMRLKLPPRDVAATAGSGTAAGTAAGTSEVRTVSATGPRPPATAAGRERVVRPARDAAGVSAERTGESADTGAARPREID